MTSYLLSPLLHHSSIALQTMFGKFIRETVSLTRRRGSVDSLEYHGDFQDTRVVAQSYQCL
jgi:hypothetical protein